MLSTVRAKDAPIRVQLIKKIHFRDIQKIRTKSVISIKITPKCVFPTPVLAAEVRKHNSRPNEFLIILCEFCLLTRRDLAGFFVEFLQFVWKQKSAKTFTSLFITVVSLIWNHNSLLASFSAFAFNEFKDFPQ